MRHSTFLFLLLQTVSVLATDKPTWSRFAAKLAPCPSSEFGHCRSVKAAHGEKAATLYLIPMDGDFDGRLSLRTEGDRTFPLPMDDDWNYFGGVDLLWSQDSRFLAITGGLNAYTESTRVYKITRSGVEVLDVFREATADMLKSFPPCKASGVEPRDCERQEQNPFFNYAAIAWSSPNSLIVMSEVPCSSSYGSYMCQVIGYEIDVQTGHVLHQMNAERFKTKWQHAMAWNFRIPEPPPSAP
jgi:hypothetical protein